MKTLNISIEIEGKENFVGRIEGNSAQDATFTYSKEYLESGHSPISISLPLQKGPFSPDATANFFEGLLPEGFARKSVSDWLHASEDDYLTILQALGEECLGAIRVYGEKGSSSADYEELTLERVKALAREGISETTEMVVEAHLSLTGASGKVGLYYEESSGKWYLPKGTAPSTHIVKQSHVRLGKIVTNEQLCMMTAKALGLEVPESFIVNMGSAEEGDVLFATKRYDRVFTKACANVGTIPRPLRLHQEDFAQALGIPAKEKYEQGGGLYLKKVFEVVKNYCLDPISDIQKLWDIIVFDFLVGNTDNHIKNISLLYTPDMRGVRLAPAYDIVSTCVYKESSRMTAIGIGGEFDINKIGLSEFAAAAQEAGLAKKLATERLENMASHFEKALKDSARLLEEKGFIGARGIGEDILKTGGYKNLDI